MRLQVYVNVSGLYNLSNITQEFVHVRHALCLLTYIHNFRNSFCNFSKPRENKAENKQKRELLKRNKTILYNTRTETSDIHVIAVGSFKLPIKKKKK